MVWGRPPGMGIAMKCSRCGGMMIYEKVYSDTEQCWTWKCICCGDYVDPVILENRECQKTRKDGNQKQGSVRISQRLYSDV